MEYEAVVRDVDLVKLINGYTTPEASPILQQAKDIGFVMHDSGPAPQRRGPVRREISDDDMETQRLHAKRAELVEKLQQHRFDLAEGDAQAHKSALKLSEVHNRKRALEARAIKVRLRIICSCAVYVIAHAK